MAIEGANVIGASPVYDTSRDVNLYAKLMAQQQAKVAQEQKQLTDKLSAVKTTGLREADRSDYNKLYNEWRNAELTATKERDQFKKAELRAEADKKYMEAQQLVNDSKSYGKLWDDTSRQFIGKDPYDTFEEENWSRWMKSRDLPLSSQELVRNPLELQARPDLSKTVTKLDALDKNLKSFATDTGKPIITRVTRGGDVGNRIIDVSAVNPKFQAERYAEAYDTDYGFKRGIRALYPDLDWQNNPDQAKTQAILDLVQKRKLEYQGAPKYQYERKTKGKGEDDTSRIGEPRKQTFQGAEYNEAGNRTKQINITSNNFVDQNVPGSLALNQLDGVYNTSTGATGRVNFNENAKVTGFGYFPNREKSGKVEDRLWMSVLSDGRYYLVPDRSVPQSVKSKKEYKAAINALQANRGIKGSAQSAKPTATISQIKSLVGKKGYEGYTEKELIEYYKSQGFTIK